MKPVLTAQPAKFVTRLLLPSGGGHHWKEEVTRPRRGEVDSSDTFQMGGNLGGSSMFLLVTMYNKCCMFAMVWSLPKAGEQL